MLAIATVRPSTWNSRIEPAGISSFLAARTKAIRLLLQLILEIVRLCNLHKSVRGDKSFKIAGMPRFVARLFRGEGPLIHRENPASEDTGYNNFSAATASARPSRCA